MWPFVWSYAFGLCGLEFASTTWCCKASPFEIEAGNECGMCVPNAWIPPLCVPNAWIHVLLTFAMQEQCFPTAAHDAKAAMMTAAP